VFTQRKAKAKQKQGKAKQKQGKATHRHPSVFLDKQVATKQTPAINRDQPQTPSSS
jgi:hypothetical protein